MQIKELIDKIENRFPLHLQEKWDNSGIQLGDTTKELTNILLCLDVTEESIQEAIDKNCNIIISHHPLIFNSIKNIVVDFKGKKIIKAIKNDICIYSAHTSSDVNGFNTFVFDKIGLNSEGKIYNIDEEHGYGDYCNIEITLEDICEKLKSVFKLDNLIFYGYKHDFSKVGLVTGSGMSFLDDVILKGIDLYLTADVKHHDAMDSIERGVSIIDLTHEASEKLFVEFMYEILYTFVNKDTNIYKYYNIDKYKISLL